MKKVLGLFTSAILISTMIVISCQKEESLSQARLMKKSTVFQTHEIGYLNEGDVFVDITQSEYQDWLRSVLDIDDTVTIDFDDTEFNEDGGDYYLKTTWTYPYDENVTVTAYDQLNDVGTSYRLDGETCTCESTGCSSGCEAQASPGNCSCTACFGGSCTKKHTITQNPYSHF